ncbi:MAG: NADH-quinone oxidoreductase subunit NuoE [Candidatus Riflebacteria bacterium HGW-Riflebacteria-2]|jgi:NADH-quinone oxidoreductase E subunit|nr:MAG: NADH-quinone oxidoreductase subunit NuoE [Candidatus Riflebacteria bacterium HGW-Riflebacteria-2]
MLASEREQLKAEINKMAKKFDYHRSGLIPVLQYVQNISRHISPESMQDIAEAFKIHPVEVQGVVSFYSFLSIERKGKFVVRLCRTISCDMAGKEAVANQLENELGIEFGETTDDGMFTLEFTNCLGMCDMGPAMLVNDDIHTRVTPEKVADIIDSYRNRFGAHVTHGEHA